ncbi:hypothetical protein AB0G02_15975 [Actinosynnema sp. NPDC023658]|uniref:hypothetical protein n=1 Tax=Actinosynnema sp. NPDC023658 TaxID=3155465 RepID=UPI0033CED3D5
MDSTLPGVELLQRKLNPGEALEADIDAVNRALDLHLTLTPSLRRIGIDLSQSVVQLPAVLAPIRWHRDCFARDRARWW